MSQDRASGAAANTWGRETARALALRLGGTQLSQRSNECMIEGRRVVIHCARPRTDSVGVTFAMLDRLDDVIGAFQRDDGAFDLWSITPVAYRDHMRDTRSRGASAGKVGIVRRDVFQTKGKSMGSVRL